MRERKQSSTTHPINFLMVLSSDHITGATGITLTVTISKDCGSFAAPAGAVSEMGNGWYSLAGNATDRATLGAFVIHATGAGCDPTDRDYTIVAYDPFDANLALTGLNGLAAAGGAGGVLTYGSSPPAAPAAGTVDMALSWAAGKVSRTFTAQGGTSSTIILDAGASAVNNAYKDHLARLTGGTGAGQTATILSYDGTTKIATIFRPSGGWTITPDNTTTGQIEAVPAVDLQAVQTFNNAGQTSPLPANTTQWLGAGVAATGGVPNVYTTNVVGTPAAGALVAGSTNASIVISGLPAGSSYVGSAGANPQKLVRALTGEARVIAAQTVGGGNYTFTFGSGTGELGPFSTSPSLSVGELFYPMP